MEAQIDKLTAAIVALNCTLIDLGKRGPIIGVDQAAIDSTKTAAPKAADKPAAPAAAKKEEPKADPKKDAVNDVTYDVVKKAFIALAEAKGRDAAVAAIAPLPTLKEIEAKEQKPGQYREVLTAIEKAAA